MKTVTKKFKSKIDFCWNFMYDLIPEADARGCQRQASTWLTLKRKTPRNWTNSSPK